MQRVKIGFLKSKDVRLVAYRDPAEVVYPSDNFSYDALKSFVDAHARPFFLKYKPNNLRESFSLN